MMRNLLDLRAGPGPTAGPPQCRPIARALLRARSSITGDCACALAVVSLVAATMLTMRAALAADAPMQPVQTQSVQASPTQASPTQASSAQASSAQVSSAQSASAQSASAQASSPSITELRVCADPDNLPFSRSDGTGFENRIAKLVADDLGVPLSYEWLPDRRGFVRKTLGEKLCDVIIGVPVGFERAMTTKPYYRSGYALVQRTRDPSPAVDRFDDPRLARMKIGVQLIGNDQAPSPPGIAVARRGWIDNVQGFILNDGPPSGARMIAALERGDIDVAMIWGPQAGWYAKRATKPLSVRIADAPDAIDIPFAFSIAMGVRRGDGALKAMLDDVIARRRADIDRILDEFAVPRLPLEASR